MTSGYEPSVSERLPCEMYVNKSTRRNYNLFLIECWCTAKALVLLRYCSTEGPRTTSSARRRGVQQSFSSRLIY